MKTNIWFSVIKRVDKLNYHRERFTKLTFRALVLRSDEGLTLETSGPCCSKADKLTPGLV